MNKLFIAAVAATMTSVAMADISISGAAKVNNLNGHATDDGTTMEADLKVSGKSGDTGVVAMISLDGGQDATKAMVEQLYVTSSIAGVAVKVGSWKGGKSELTQAGGQGDHRYNVSTTFGGVKLAYEDNDNGNNSSTISGTVGGIAISHKSVSDDTSETKASGSVGGVAAKMHQQTNSSDVTNTSVTLTTAVQGINLTYVDVKADFGTKMDGFFGKKDAVSAASGFGISTDVAGNKVTYKTMEIDTVDTKKVIITRKLASGATFEATYANTDDKANTLDLELAVKF